MLTIDPDLVCRLIVRARQFDVKVAPVEDDPASNMAEDEMLEVIEDFPADDAVEEELRETISGLNEDERAELVALAWVGRDSFSVEEWQDAVQEAREQHDGDTSGYLMGLPLLGDYLAEGLAAFGHTCSE